MAGGITIRGTGGRATVSLTALSVLAGTSCTKLVDEMTNRILLVAKATVPVRTGNLRASHTPSIRQEAMRVVGQVSAEAEYAAFVHNGFTMRNGKKRRANPWLARAARSSVVGQGWKFTANRG
jgi:hypothetical protein